MYKFLSLVLLLHIIHPSSTQDSKIFEIQWSNSPTRPTKKDGLEKFDVTSSIGEKYTCFIAKNEPANTLDHPYYRGPLGVDFIEHLFNKGICSYRIEPYWTYELCHGRHLRQYHEVIEGPRLKLQQYTLGRIGVKEREMIIRKKKEEETKIMQNSTFKLPTKKVDNKELPYIEIPMTDGSVCEYNKKILRRSNVYYMCDMKANHDLHSVEEVSTCVYEILILTPILCAHPGYKPRKTPTGIITCYANGKSKVPYNLAKIYWERKKIIQGASKGEHRMELLSYDKSDNSLGIDPLLVDDFLAGKNCISGGTGGWKYEFCYGRYVNQYTYGIFGMKTTVCLGKFNVHKHLEWMRNRPYKRPKPLGYRTHITQFYTDGSLSNVTGRPRQTEVKLKCMEDTENKNALVMYLYETNPGEYLLGIESPMLCHVVPMADEDGLIFHKK